MIIGTFGFRAVRYHHVDVIEHGMDLSDLWRYAYGNTGQLLVRRTLELVHDSRTGARQAGPPNRGLLRDRQRRFFRKGLLGDPDYRPRIAADLGRMGFT